MSAAKHTPGPWEWCPHSFMSLRPTNPDPESHHVHTILDHDGYYGFLMAPLESVEAENKANRALIAAAPDLLDAAKLVLAWYEAENDHKGTSFMERVDMCRDSEKALRAAIAKATGVQP